MPKRFIPTYMGNALLRGRPRRQMPVHPHVHGERQHLDTIDARRHGSSPRTWGTLQYQADQTPFRRFIPTYMGNARIRSFPLAPTPVHPHVHGERSALWYPESEYYGSSPRTWGTPGLFAPPKNFGRFIPTYMGNATPIRRSSTRATVHPHVHGERGRTHHETAGRFGSSPRTWGTLSIPPSVDDRVRFIPTYMGNARATSHNLPSTTVHPHVHGERVGAPNTTR